MDHYSRVLLIELGGAGYDVLMPLATAGTMPNVARLMRSAALARLRGDGPFNDSVTWATLQAGGGPDVHGMLDDRYLDHRRRCVLPGGIQRSPHPTLGDLVTAVDPRLPTVQLTDGPFAVSICERQPADFTQLSREINRVETAVGQVMAKVRQLDQARLWRLLQVRFTLLDPLLHRLWHLLGLADSSGANRRWIAKTRQAFRTLDHCLGELLALAQRRGAALVLVSPYGFGPFREKITLGELLRRRDLLHFAGGTAKIGYRISRMAWKACRLSSQGWIPLAGLMPVDWRRTRAVTLHGNSAALVYLNTPQRFGTRVLVTSRQRDEAAAELMAALGEARHPLSDEPLFADVYLSEERFGVDPFQRCWPEVVAIPAAGFQTRHRFDRNRHLLRADSSLRATRTGEGLLMVHAPGAALGQPCTADVADVAPTVLALLGLPRGAAMTGRELVELFASPRPA